VLANGETRVIAFFNTGLQSPRTADATSASRTGDVSHKYDENIVLQCQIKELPIQIQLVMAISLLDPIDELFARCGAIVLNVELNFCAVVNPRRIAKGSFALPPGTKIKH
jgi:hypothetical protein